MRCLVIISILVVLVASTAQASFAQTPADQTTAPANQVEPELELTDLNGTRQKLSSLRGRIVVLNFWATYCLPCREEMPALAAIQTLYGAYGVQVIGASADFVDEKQGVLKFIKKLKINFPIWLEASNRDMARFGLGPALPGTAIIDSAGKIVWRSKKPVTRAELKTHLDALLAQLKSDGEIGYVGGIGVMRNSRNPRLPK